MTTQTPAIAIPAPRHGPGRRLGFGLAIGAVVAVTAGVGLWQAERGGTTDPASPPTAAVERTAEARPAETATTVYVVGSAAQAEAVQRGIADADAIRAQVGEASLATQVTVVADGEADAFFRMMAEQDAIRAELGLPGLTVVDLRPQPAAAEGVGSIDPAASSDQELYQRWLAAQAATGPEPVSHPDGAGVTVPATGAVETMGGLAELIRDGGTPAAAPAARAPNAATSGNLPVDVSYLTP